jgi:hypothetical protein
MTRDARSHEINLRVGVSVAGVVNMGWTIRAWNREKVKRFLASRNIHIGSGAHSASYSVGTGVISG